MDPPSNSSETSSRLDVLEQSITQLAEGLDQCRQQQKDLAHAITAMFDWLTESTVLRAKRAPSAKSTDLPAPPPAASVDEPAPLPAPSPAAPADESMVESDDSCDGPIVGLALNG